MMSMAVARGTGRSDSKRLVWHRATGGLLQEGAFDEAGKQTGLWKRYHSNGRLLDVGEYGPATRSASGSTTAPTGRSAGQSSTEAPGVVVGAAIAEADSAGPWLGGPYERTAATFWDDSMDVKRAGVAGLDQRVVTHIDDKG